MQYFDFPNHRPQELDAVAIALSGQRALSAVRRNKPEPHVVRGGSTGALIDGEIYGICHRKAWLRLNGVSKPLPEEIELMTKQGEKNEEIWLTELRAGIQHPYIVRDQTEFDSVWEIKDGSQKIGGSGSEDIVIWNTLTGLPELGLELKNVSAASKAKSVHYELRPGVDNLVQAANYSLRMGDQYNGGVPLPYRLVYSSRSMWQLFAMPEKAKQQIVERGWDVDYKFGKPMTVLPFHRVYNLYWENGYLVYDTHGLKAPVTTKLTRESIDEYYRVVAFKIDSEGHLGPRPTTKHLDGKAAYSPCGYCDFSSLCETQEKQALSNQEFLDLARKFVEDGINN